MRRKTVVITLGLLLILACTAAYAQNPIVNPSFENGLTGWTTYTYVTGQSTGTVPMVGDVGGDPANTFHVLHPNQGAADGINVCGLDGWYDAKTGGVYQTFTAADAGYLVIAARAYSATLNPYIEQDKGPRVRAAVVAGTQTSRSVVPFTGTGAWKSCAWGPSWVDIIIQVPSAGTYTLFIENLVVWDDHIFNTVWDNIRWAAGTVNITNQPYVSQITETSATIHWDTDVAGTSVINYDMDGPPYDNTISGGNGTHHVVTLTGLTPGTIYQFSAQTDAPPAPTVNSPNVFFETAHPALDQLYNGEFEDKDGEGNPTLAPWVKFGKFDGVRQDDPVGVRSHSGQYYAGAISTYENTKTLSGCYQRVNVKPDTNYLVRAWVFTQNTEHPDPVSWAAAWNTKVRVGINPKGGVDLWYTNPSNGQPIYDPLEQVYQDHPDIAWTDWDFTQDWEEPYTQLGYKEIFTIVHTPADSTVATVFLQVQHLWAMATNITVFDDVIFMEEVPIDTLGKAKWAPVNWVVNMDNGGEGYLVTRFEFMPDPTGLLSYVWIQEDDRSGALKVNLGTLEGASNIFPGDRITISGRIKKPALSGRDWGEVEVLADAFTVVSSGNPEAQPVAMGNKSVAGGDQGTFRGATGRFGANNVGLLAKTTGRVVAVEPGSGFGVYSFTIDDGSGANVTVYHPEDWMYFAEMPSVGQLVSATGVCGLKINDPTPDDYGVPNGSGDETLLPTVMLRDGRDLQVIPE